MLAILKKHNPDTPVKILKKAKIIAETMLSIFVTTPDEYVKDIKMSVFEDVEGCCEVKIFATLNNMPVSFVFIPTKDFPDIRVMVGQTVVNVTQALPAESLHTLLLLNSGVIQKPHTAIYNHYFILENKWRINGGISGQFVELIKKGRVILESLGRSIANNLFSKGAYCTFNGKVKQHRCIDQESFLFEVDNQPRPIEIVLKPYGENKNIIQHLKIFDGDESVLLPLNHTPGSIANLIFFLSDRFNGQPLFDRHVITYEKDPESLLINLFSDLPRTLKNCEEFKVKEISNQIVEITVVKDGLKSIFKVYFSTGINREIATIKLILGIEDFSINYPELVKNQPQAAYVLTNLINGWVAFWGGGYTDFINVYHRLTETANAVELVRTLSMLSYSGVGAISTTLIQPGICKITFSSNSLRVFPDLTSGDGFKIFNAYVKYLDDRFRILDIVTDLGKPTSIIRYLEGVSVSFLERLIRGKYCGVNSGELKSDLEFIGIVEADEIIKTDESIVNDSERIKGLVNDIADKLHDRVFEKDLSNPIKFGNISIDGQESIQFSCYNIDLLLSPTVDSNNGGGLGVSIMDNVSNSWIDIIDYIDGERYIKLQASAKEIFSRYFQFTGRRKSQLNLRSKTDLLLNICNQAKYG